MDTMESGSAYAATEKGASAKPRKHSLAEGIIREMLASADIAVNGCRPWDPQIHDARFYPRLLAEGTLGLGESYMEGWWVCEALDEMCCRAIRARMEDRLPLHFRTVLSAVSSVLINHQSRRRARRVGERHYDLGNDFFKSMLDPLMQYSCAYFCGANDLAVALPVR